MPVLDLVRHAVPVLEFYLFGGVIERYALPALYSGMIAFYDARPDIGERLFPELWRQPRPVRADAAVKRPAGRQRKR